MTVPTNSNFEVDTSQNPISIPSSPEPSPEIEVAVVEEYDQDPSETKWTPITNISNHMASHSLRPFYVHQTFPYAARTRPGAVNDIFPELFRVLQFGGDGDHAALTNISRWLNELVQQFDCVTPLFLAEEPGFWEEFPELVISLLRRDIDPPTQGRVQPLRDFFSNFARLTVLILRSDLPQMESYSEDSDPRNIKDPLSRSYINTLGYILHYRDVPLYHRLRHAHESLFANLISSLVDRLADPEGPDMLALLHDYISCLAVTLPKKPSLVHSFRAALFLAGQFAHSLHDRQAFRADDKYLNAEVLTYIRQKCLQLFQAADEILQTAITKQLSWLTIDSSPALLSILSQVMDHLGNQIPDFGFELLAAAGVDQAELGDERPRSLFYYAWRFKTLRKYMMNGRMELRVHGIDTMQADLVDVYRDHVRDNQTYAVNPLVQFFLKFLQNNKIIEYIIGVDSHPQLISRSNNIIGFLSVTGYYSNAETDTIWQTVTDSHDPRIVTEVLQLLKSIFQTGATLDDLHYMCDKLLALPLEKTDQRILDFATDLFFCIRDKTRTTPGFATQSLYGNIFKVCVRLLRDICVAENPSSDRFARIRHVASDLLTQMLRPLHIGGPTADGTEQQEETWEALVADVKDNSPYATGSIQALNSWLYVMDAEAVDQVVQKFDYTEALAANTKHISESLLGGGPYLSTTIESDSEVRLMAFGLIITRTPESLTADTLESFWTSLFTAPQLPEIVRLKAWETLTNVIRPGPSMPNLVIDYIIADYLPRVEPRDMTRTYLTFLQHAVGYESRLRSPLAVPEGEVVTIPGIERLWQVILETPSQEVQIAATDFVIKQYLDHPLITRRPKASIEATHLWLVDRCVQQVMASATRLKSITDSASSTADGIVMINSSEVQVEDTRFDRSLTFLRRFLEGIKSRPRYSPLPETDFDRLQDTFQTRGDVFTANLQIFGSNRISESPRDIPLGTTNTGGELWQYMADLTGFAQFSIIIGGRKVSLKDEKATLNELKIGQGRIMIHKAPGSEEHGPADKFRAATPVDSKVMDHFGELYELLDADERLARQVFTFLGFFAAQSSVIKSVRTKTASADELLPAEKPYKLLYGLRAVRSCIEDESFSSTPDGEFLRYGVNTIIATFPRLELSGPDDFLQMYTAQGLLEALLLAFRAKVPPEISQAYIPDHGGFVLHLLRLIQNGQHSTVLDGQQLTPQTIVREPFEVLIEGALHDTRVWPELESDNSTLPLLKSILLDDSRPEVRRAILDVLLGLCGSSGAKLVLKVHDPRAARSRFPADVIESSLARLWQMLLKVLPCTIQKPSQSREFFEVALAVMRRLSKNFQPAECRTLLETGMQILGQYEHTEVRSETSYIRARALTLCRILAAMPTIMWSGGSPSSC